MVLFSEERIIMLLKDRCKIGFFSCVIDENKIYACVEDKNGFCVIDRESYRVDKYLIFEDEPYCGYRLFHGMSKFGDFIILTPGNANAIYIYDLKQNRIDKFEVEGYEELLKNNNYVFSKCIPMRDLLFCIGCSEPLILVINIETKEEKKIKIPKEIDVEKSRTLNFSADGYVIRGEKIIFALSCDDYLIEIDTVSLSLRLVKIKNGRRGFDGISAKNDDIYLVSQGDLFEYNYQTQITKKYVIEKTEKKQYFYAPVLSDNDLYLFPLFGDKLFSFNIVNRKVNEEPLLNDVIEKTKKVKCKKSVFKTLCPTVIEHKLCFFTGLDFVWHEYCKDDNTWKAESFNYTLNQVYEERYYQDLKTFMYERSVLREFEYLLEDFVKALSV